MQKKNDGFELKKELIQYLAVGILYSFVLKNFISITNKSFGGDPMYIISNPSIDAELWYILFFSYFLIVRRFYFKFHNLVKDQFISLNTYLKKFLEILSGNKIAKYLIPLITIVFYLLVMLSIGVTLSLLMGMDKLINWINSILVVHLAILFKMNFIEFSKSEN